MNRIEFPPALFTRELAAYYLSMSVREIDDLRQTNEITAVGTGKRVKFRKSDLDRIADLDAGRPVTVHGWQIRGAQGVERNGVYTLDAAGNLTPAQIDRR